MELGVNNKLHQLDDAINRILEAILAKQDPIVSHGIECSEHSSNRSFQDQQKSDGPMFSSKLDRLDSSEANHVKSDHKIVFSILPCKK